MPYQPPLVYESAASQACVIWLHGLGADGYDFADVVNHFGLIDQGVRFVLPHAPFRSVTVNGGMQMRAWFNIQSQDFVRNEDRAGFEHSLALVQNWVDEQQQSGIPPERVVLAGFSQGAAVSLYSALRLRQRLGGVIALSGYLPFAEHTAQEADPANHGIPLFLAHGARDPVVPFPLGETSRSQLQHYFELQWQSYDMGHSVCQEEIEAIGTWLRQTLSV